LLAKVEQECRLLWPKLWQLRGDLEEAVLNGRLSTPAEIEAQVLQQAQAFFHQLWRHLTVAERLALYQLAHHQILNPRNLEVTRRLLDRGLVEAQPTAALTSGAFRIFILGAEPPEVFAAWQADAEAGIWQEMRMPLLIVLLLLLGWLAYSYSEAFSAVSLVVTGTLALANNLARAFGLIRGGSSAKD
jgi:hypothetical protein